MSKPEWTKIGNVEVCVGTDGVTGVWNGTCVSAIHPGATSPDWITTKELFEVRYCQPPKPRHTIRESADGSCVVESTEQDEQGRPLRAAIVRYCGGDYCVAEWAGHGGLLERKQYATARAIRYVEEGE